MRLGSSLAGAIQGISRRLPLAVVFLLCAVVVEANGQNASATPSEQNHSVMMTRLYTGANGQSHIDQVPVAFHGAPDEVSAAERTSSSYLARGAPGVFETWHVTRRKRYIAVISGEAEVTTKDGERATLVPGRLYLTEDTTGKGHTFRVLGKQEWIALFVDFAE